MDAAPGFCRFRAAVITCRDSRRTDSKTGTVSSPRSPAPARAIKCRFRQHASHRQTCRVPSTRGDSLRLPERAAVTPGVSTSCWEVAARGLSHPQLTTKCGLAHTVSPERNPTRRDSKHGTRGSLKGKRRRDVTSEQLSARHLRQTMVCVAQKTRVQVAILGTLRPLECPDRTSSDVEASRSTNTAIQLTDFPFASSSMKRSDLAVVSSKSGMSPSRMSEFA